MLKMSSLLHSSLPPNVTASLKQLKISTPFQLLALDTYELSKLVRAPEDEVDRWKRVVAAEILSQARMLDETEQQRACDSFQPGWQNLPSLLIPHPAHNPHPIPYQWKSRPTGCAAVDSLLYTPMYGGGLPAGRIIELLGSSGTSAGRTALSLSAACACAAATLPVPALVIDTTNAVVFAHGSNGVAGLIARTIENLEAAAEAEAANPNPSLSMPSTYPNPKPTPAPSASSTPSKLRHSVNRDKLEKAMGALHIQRWPKYPKTPKT